MTDGVRRLSHEDAEMLISARMDEQLDRADSRALLVHLQTCESCRAFAVQSEVLGRELAALPVLPASAIVDRQIRETIAQGTKRWSVGNLFPATGGNSGLRTALGALAVLMLVSVYLLVRMAGDHNGSGPSIEAPTGGVAQQLESTSTAVLAMAPETAVSGPTETARVVAPPTQAANGEQTVVPTQAGSAPTEAVAVPTERTGGETILPTATLDSNYVSTIDKTNTPSTGNGAAKTPTAAAPQPNEGNGDVSIASVGGESGTPVEPTEKAASELSPGVTGVPATPAQESGGAAPEETSAPEVTPTEIDATATPPEPTEEPATEAPPSPTLEPTMTATPVEISVDATDVPAEPATQPPAVESPSGPTGDTGSDATATPAGPGSTPTQAQIEDTPTDAPANESGQPTETPQGPFTQPTIAPISGQSATTPEGGTESGQQGDQQDGGRQNGNVSQGNDQPTAGGDSTSTNGNDSPPIVPNDGSDVQASSATGTEGNSPKIVSSNATDVPDGSSATESSGGQGGGDGVGGETQPVEASAIPTVDNSVAPSGLDLSDTVTELPAGTSSPLGRLEFSPGSDLYAVIAPDGSLAVANLDGELVVTFGAGDLPVWSGTNLMFAVPGDNGTVVGIWDSDNGELNYVPTSADEASSDLPIGGDGTSLYYLRTFPDRAGAMEIRSAASDGSDQGLVWSSDSTTLGGARPVWSSDGILLPTDSNWLLIGTDGSESEVGSNAYGYVGAPVLSPGEGLMAYSAGDQVIVAWTEDPGTAVATAPFGGASGGYAFSTTGEQIVVSDGSSLHVVSYEGDDLGTLAGNQPIGGVYWLSDTIYYLQIGEHAALKSTSLDAIQSS